MADPPTPSHELLAAAVTNGPDAMIVVDGTGSLVFANERASSLFGYTNETLMSMGVEQLVPSAQRASHIAHRVRFAASPTTRPMGIGLQLRAQRADSSLVPVEISLSNVAIDEQAFTIAAIRDVTESRRMTADLARMANALDATTDGVLLLDPMTLEILMANEGAATLTGFARSELRSMSQVVFSGDIPADDLRAMIGAVRDGLERSITFVARCRRKEGRMVSLESMVSRFESVEDRPSLVVAIRDVSHHEIARKSLAAQRDHFARLLSTLREATIELSTEGLVLDVNERFCEMTGIARPDAIGSSRPFSWFPKDAMAETEELLDRALRVDAVQAEIEIIDRSQRQFPVLLTTKRLDGDSLNPTTVFATLRDLTTEKRAAQALTDARTALALSDDRDRIARDLHDRVIQRVFGVGLTLEGLLSRVSDAQLTDRWERSIAQLDLTIREIRASIFDLEQTTPAQLSQRIGQLVTDYERLLGFAPELRCDRLVDEAVPANVAEELLSVAREALSNVARHADASMVTVRVSVVDEPSTGLPEIRLVISDNGVGLVARPTHGRGLTNMRERAERLGGHFEIDPGDSSGTVLRWAAPLPDRAPR